MAEINAFTTNLLSALSGVTAGTPRTATGTLILAEAGTVVEMNVATANNITIPPNSSVAFPLNTIIEICQIGAGSTTILPGAGVTLRPASSAVISGQWRSASIRQRAANEWVVGGDIL